MKQTKKYRDLIIAANQNLKEKEYWMTQLGGEFEKNIFPYDHKKSIKDRCMSEKSFMITGESYSSLMALCKNSEPRLHVILISFLNLLINKYTGSLEIIVGTPIYKQKVDGDFINTLLILRNQLNYGMTFKEIILNAKDVLVKATENRNYPMEILSDQLDMPFSEEDDFPLLDIIIVIENIHDIKYIQHINCNLIFSFLNSDNRIKGTLKYNSSLYEETTINRIIHYFLYLIQTTGANIDLKLSDTSLLSNMDKQKILFEFNNTKTELIRDKCFHQLYEESTLLTPGRIAAKYKAEHMSYSELNNSADHIAQQLLEKGVKPNSFVSLFLERSIDFLVSILGVFKAGGAYLPIEIEWPKSRIQYILQNSETSIVIADKDRFELLNHMSISPDLLCLYYNELIITKKDDNRENKSALRSETTHPSNLAYMIYTSGTTGVPKGVMIHHLGMINHIYAKIIDLAIVEDDVIAQTASACFDISVWQFLAVLLEGGQVLIINKETLLELREFLCLLQKANVSILESVPSLTSAFLEMAATVSNNALPNLRWMIQTGEHLNVQQARDWYHFYPSIKLLNAYGPTEASDDVSHYVLEEIPHINQGTIPIGTPIQNTHLYIMDNNMSLCPIGVRGEICVSGIGVGKGYWKLPEKTEYSFLPNPYLKEIGDTDYSLLYRTGDVGYIREDGIIECLGRLDFQVKIRGNRIEIGEIENHLIQHEDIKQAVVVVTGKSDKQLYAYIVSENPVSEAKLKEYLEDKIPQYMIPAQFICIEKIPLTQNGKIDRKLLSTMKAELKTEFLPPQDKVQLKLVEIWSDVLGIEKDSISINHNFFQLGGHSLKATILISKIHKELNIKLPLVEIFNTPSIEGLSLSINKLAEDLSIQDNFVSITPTEKKEYYTLSSAQKRLYVLQQMTPDSIAYNMPEMFTLPSEFDYNKIQLTVERLIKRHESLRTSFHLINNRTVQKIQENVKLDIYNNTIEDDSIIRNKIIKSFICPFNLSYAPLIRIGVIKTNDKRALLLVDMHHIISDGISHQILVKDFLSLYDDEELTPLRIQYKDYSEWQNSEKERTNLKNQEEFWLRQFEGEIPVLDLPYDFPRPLLQSFEGDKVNFSIPVEETRSLNEMCMKGGYTLFMLIETVINVFLAKLSGQEEIIIGTPIAGRRHADLEKFIGMFVNTLALRNYPTNTHTFFEFLQEVKEKTLMIFENQEYPFEELVDKLSVKRDIGRNPLFDVVFVMQNLNSTSSQQDEIQHPQNNQSSKNNFSIPQENIIYTAKFDLTINTFERNGMLYFSIQYCTKLFKEDTITRFSLYLKKIISIILQEPDIRLSNIEIITEDEKKALLNMFNESETGYPTDKTIVSIFEEQVEKTPDSIALNISDTLQKGNPKSLNTSPTHISYRELKDKSEQLAIMLMQKMMLPGVNYLIGMIMNRSIEMIIGILGIIKTGSAYVPIDPEYPLERKYFMLKDSKTKLILTQNNYSSEVETLIKYKTTLDIETVLFEPSGFTNPSSIKPVTHSCLKSSDVAYVIYTSGTTGRPKGVLITHENVVRLLFNNKFQFEFSDTETWTFFHSYCFDFSVWEIYGALLYGGRLLIVPKVVTRDPNEFLYLLRKEKVTVLNQTPSAFYNIIFEDMKYQQSNLKLKYVIFGGEALSPKKLFNWKNKYPNIKLINMFGITETTVHVTYKEITPNEINDNKSCIGKPIPTLSIYLLEPGLILSPVGVPGELCVGGKGVGRGYLNRPELTDEKFIINPFKKNDRLYKSGDLAKMSQKGELEYLGRIDQQVQIRGFRVETGEIENQLLTHRDVKNVVIIVKESEDNNKFLIAYIVSDSEPSISQFREFLANRLPEYMIPSFFIQIPQIPLTSNGKIDRSKLPEPAASNEEIYIAPGNELEKELQHTWNEILGPIRIGISDNFFNIGGDSIKAIRLVSSINNKFNVGLKIVDLFTNSTIRELSQVVKKGTAVQPEKEKFEVQKEIAEFKERILKSAKVPPDVEDILPMSDIEKGMIFHAYKNPDESIYHDQFVYYQRYPLFDQDLFRKALELMVEKHEALRISFNVDDFDEFVHFIHKPFSPEYKHRDISDQTPQSQRQEIERYMREDRKQRWDIKTPPLYRMATFDLGSDTICAVWTFHHAILDGWSNASLMTELNNTYMELKSGKNDPLSHIKISYKDFIINEMVEKKNTSNIAFWKNELDGYKRIVFPNDQIEETNDIRNFVPPNNQFLGDKLLKIPKQLNITLKNVCFAAYVYMLSMITYENEVVVGLVSNNRPEMEDGDKLIGCFLNTLPIRITIPNEITYEEYIRYVDRKLIQLKNYEKITFFEIVKIIGERHRTGNAVYDTIFNYVDFHIYEQATGTEKPAIHDGKQLVQGYERTNTLFDFNVTPTSKGVKVVMRYSTSIISDQLIRKLYNYFEKFLEMIILHPKDALTKDKILTKEELQEVLYHFNSTETKFIEDKTLIELFEEQTQLTPDNSALILKNELVTYQQLNKETDKLTQVLTERLRETNSIIGIMSERSLDVVIAILSILKSGNAYLPIDPDLPEDRIHFILKDSKPKLLVTTGDLIKKVTAEMDIVLLRETTNQFAEPVIRKSQTSVADLAYIIYTSGSTGIPKGVIVEHKSVLNILSAMQNLYPLRENEAYLLKTSYVFDVSVTELFGWFFGGGRLVLLERDGEKDPYLIIKTINRHKVTHINFIPSMFNAFIEQLNEDNILLLSNLKYIFLAGEALLPATVDKFKKMRTTIKLENLYGPTEGTVYSSVYSLSQRNENEIIPIGKPIDNVQLHILDKNLHCLPIGVPGELIISGVGVARGYLNRTELTFEKFISPALSSKYMKRINYEKQLIKEKNTTFYLTGDLTRWLSDGNIEFLGRIDHQVKIRGYRIELGEIENKITDYPGIKNAVALCRENESGDKYISAYIVSPQQISIVELKEHLMQYLPGYMIPTSIYQLDTIPQTITGKIDRNVLQTYKEDPSMDGEFTAPNDDIEKKLSEIWSEILEVEKEKIGVKHNFFQLGGTSLSIIKQISKIYKVFGVEMTVTLLSHAPTIIETANFIKSKRYVDEPVIIFNEGKAKKIFCFPPVVGFGVLYQRLSELFPDYTFYSFNFIDDENRLNIYRDIMVNAQPSDPFILFGWSAAGKIIFDITKTLETVGRSVSDIILADSSFEKKQVFDEKIYEEDFKKFLKKVEQNLSKLKVEFLAEKVKKRSEMYSKYTRNADTLAVINAKVHLITSEEARKSKLINFHTWDEFTSKEVILYNGYGKHENMLSSGHLKKNAEIIKKILHQIEAKINFKN